jgi:hypothetical protein
MQCSACSVVQCALLGVWISSRGIRGGSGFLFILHPESRVSLFIPYICHMSFMYYVRRFVSFGGSVVPLKQILLAALFEEMHNHEPPPPLFTTLHTRMMMGPGHHHHPRPKRSIEACEGRTLLTPRRTGTHLAVGRSNSRPEEQRVYSTRPQGKFLASFPSRPQIRSCVGVAAAGGVGALVAGGLGG